MCAVGAAKMSPDDTNLNGPASGLSRARAAALLLECRLHGAGPPAAVVDTAKFRVSAAVESN